MECIYNGLYISSAKNDMLFYNEVGVLFTSPVLESTCIGKLSNF